MELNGNDKPGPAEIALILAIALLVQKIHPSGKVSDAVSQEGKAGYNGEKFSVALKRSQLGRN